MTFETKTLPAKIIVGIAVRTSNAPGAGDKDIPALWDRFMSEGIQAKIENKASQAIYGVYTNYEGDHTAPYTVIVGCEVTELPSALPEGLVSHEIAPSTYAFMNMEGSFPEGVMGGWEKAWTSGLDRSFTSDFEMYDEAFNPANGCIGSSLYIALK